MEALEFLGGKYKGGEQILPGVIQTYRATEAATGRSVFVHHVSSTDDAGQQLVLYRLLAAALVRSPSVRSMVLDMRDESNDWYVVTETAPQCLLLREWLQFELGNSVKTGDAKKGAGASPGPVQGRAADLPTVPPPLPSATHAEEPGEFTRFFAGNPPAPASKPPRAERPSNPDLQRREERSGRSGSVQRPNTPMPFVPPVAPRGAEPGEFTRLFSKPGTGESGQNARPPLERPQAATDYQDLFKSRSEPTVPAPPTAQGPGEYTRIFGKGDAPPPVQPPSAVGRKAPASHDDPLMVSEPEPANGPKGQAATGPSEYTRVLGSNRPRVPDAAEPPVQRPEGSAAVPAGPVSISANPLGAMPMPSASASVAGPSITNSMGSAHIQALHPPAPTPHVQPPTTTAGANAIASANARNTKMITFFAALGVLALLLVLIVVLALRK